MDKKALYRRIPKVDTLLAQEEVQRLVSRYGRETVLSVIREKSEEIRARIRGGGRESETEMETETDIDSLVREIAGAVRALYAPRMRRVINATGTILHTNLGRAPLSREMMERLTELMTGYSNLEYDLERGSRGERYAHFEEPICRVTGAEAAFAVNNNAAAVLLALNSIAKGGEVVISRGELVEIGGSFRVPEVMALSGAELKEVGTTNKTHFSDYERAVTERTGAFLKVHPSNYRIVGFTESVPTEQLASLARRTGIPLIEDLGSGALVDLAEYGISGEASVQAALRAGADVICFSGDKLLGGPQAGIIIGKKKYLDAMKKNPLARALRIDKFTAAALELTFRACLNRERVTEEIPVLRMMTEPPERVAGRAESLREMLFAGAPAAEIAVEAGESQIGGGSLPAERIASYIVTIRPEKISAAALEMALRRLPLPIIARVANDRVCLDLRTVEEEDLPRMAAMLKEVLS